MTYSPRCGFMNSTFRDQCVRRRRRILLLAGVVAAVVLFQGYLRAISFSSLGTFAVGSLPVAVVSADFNHDAVADIVVANSGGNTVSVLLGTGGGGLGPATDLTVGTAP